MNNIDSEESLSFVQIEIMRGSCYGSPAKKIEFNFHASEKEVSARFSEGTKTKTVSLEISEVENFLSNISAIVEKPEVSSGLRHVEIRYQAEIEWRNLAFIEGRISGKFKTFSDEWFVGQIEDFMIENEDADENFVERMQKILDEKPHRHALEIYDAAGKFFRKFFR